MSHNRRELWVSPPLIKKTDFLIILRQQDVLQLRSAEHQQQEEECREILLQWPWDDTGLKSNCATWCPQRDFIDPVDVMQEQDQTPDTLKIDKLYLLTQPQQDALRAERHLVLRDTKILWFNKLHPNQAEGWLNVGGNRAVQ